MIEIRSTKSFYNLPTAHCQFFDLEPDGSPGDCASLHGYDRSVHFEFAGTPDEQGWIYPFGELKPVKEFLEYYFDHTAVFPANDARLQDVPDMMMQPGGILGTYRVLPYGVSMEMSSLFVWEHVNPYIYKTTGGRVYVSRVEVKEHERNSGFLLADKQLATEQAQSYSVFMGDTSLPKRQVWPYINPNQALATV